jgi:hypothetical protein
VFPYQTSGAALNVLATTGNDRIGCEAGMFLLC